MSHSKRLQIIAALSILLLAVTDAYSAKPKKVNRPLKASKASPPIKPVKSSKSASAAKNGKKPDPLPTPQPSPSVTPSPSPTPVAAASPAPSTSPLEGEIPDSAPAELLFVLKPGSEIPMKWAAEKPLVKRAQVGEEVKLRATLNGVVSQAGWTLLENNRSVPIGAGGEFVIEVPIKGIATPLELTGVGPNGELILQRITINFPDFKRFDRISKKAPDKVTFWSAGGGLTSIQYSDSRLQPYSSLAMTIKGSMNHLVSPPTWDMGISAYFTLMPITKSEDVALRFFGFNLRYGYVLPQVKEPWKVSVLGGIYYTTTFVSGDKFGFKDMAGPQIFPSVRYKLKNNDSVSGYLKFSPVSADFSLLNLGNRELALGGSYSRPMEGGKTLNFSVDLANLALSFPRAQISSTNFSVGAGFGF